MKTAPLLWSVALAAVVLLGAQPAEARYYDAHVAVWLQPDRVGMPDGPNRYWYVMDRPTVRTDPTGKNTVVIIDGYGGIFGIHAAVYVDNGGNPLLFDPGGSYPGPQGYARGSTSLLIDQGANLMPFLTWSARGDNVTAFLITTTAAQEAQIAANMGFTNALSSGGEGENGQGYTGGECAAASANVLQGVGPFQNLSWYLFPSSLGDAISQVGVQTVIFLTQGQQAPTYNPNSDTGDYFQFQ
jgi:hypothetical protein